MTITMNDSPLKTIEELKRFLKSSTLLAFKGQKRSEIYEWVEDTIIKFDYHALLKKDKRIVKEYLEKITGYSRAQVTRLIAKQRRTGKVTITKCNRHIFPKVYSDKDIWLLAKTDELHDFPNGVTVKRILERMVNKYGDLIYENIANISVGYIYNLRKSVHYQRLTKKYEKTKPHVVNIGERRKPQPNGIPGYLRVDTVHQGDQEKQKGVYHINIIDEVTQWEYVGAVEKITEAQLVPLLLRLIDKYPFKIFEFHADNGSEYVNRQIANMLNRLLIKLTKSRSRQTNDNALVESKNGSIIRKWMGYGFIDQKYAKKINDFYFDVFNEYLNFHRPCAFATNITDTKGKIKKIYRQEDYLTPYEKFKSLVKSESYLKTGVTFTDLEKIAKRKTDNQIAEEVQTKRYQLFNKILPAYSSQ
jgi:transposase InsO family protein/predicted DNA-binding transcriptional regulator AlpA